MIDKLFIDIANVFEDISTLRTNSWELNKAAAERDYELVDNKMQDMKRMYKKLKGSMDDLLRKYNEVKQGGLIESFGGEE